MITYRIIGMLNSRFYALLKKIVTLLKYLQKKKGIFHHSSFLAGGATLAAGRLAVEDGVLKVP